MHVDRFTIFEADRTPKGELTKEQIELLNDWVKGTWQVNPQTGLVDVKGAVFLPARTRLKSFQGIRFGKVTWDFICSFNQFTSLEGAPREVTGSFNFSGNQLTTLVGAPRKVEGFFNCSFNQLTSLEGAPQKVGGNFWCSYNKLTSLVGGPQEVEGGFSCSDNQLTSLEGAPQEVGEGFNCQYNQLTSWKGLPKISRNRISIDQNPALDYLFSLDQKYQIDSSYYEDPLSSIV